MDVVKTLHREAELQRRQVSAGNCEDPIQTLLELIRAGQKALLLNQRVIMAECLDLAEKVAAAL